MINIYFFFRPFLFNGYGHSIYWCWIRDDNEIDELTRRMLIIFTFYLFVWLAVLYNSYNYIKIFRIIRARTTHSNSKFDIYLNKLKYLPLAFILIWTFATMDRVLNAYGDSPFIISAMHAMLESCNGFLNTLFYALNENVREEIKNIYFNVFLRRKARKNESLLLDSSF